MKHAIAALVLVLAGTAAHAQQAEPPKGSDTALQQQLQKRVQAETDQTVRRINTMLRVMSYHKIEQSEENRILGEVAGTLSSLSKDQMIQVLAKLEAATKAKDDQKAGVEIEEAYKRHREILDQLNRLLSRFDAVLSLEQASERMDKVAKDEVELFLQDAQLAREARQLVAAIQKTDETLAKETDEARKLNLVQASQGYRKRMDRVAQVMADKLADDQGDTQRETVELFRQLGELRPQLPADHQERLAKVEALYKDRQIAAALEETIRKLRSRSEPAPRAAQWKAAGFLQWKAAGDLRDLARALRSPAEDLDALREARQLLEQAIERESGLKEETVLPPPSKEWERMERRARDLGDRQARIEFDTRDTKALLKPRAASVAAKIEPAEALMRDAQEALRDQALAQSTPAQDKAVSILKDALKELDRVIKEAEKAKEDPIAALKALSDSIDKLIQDQKETKEKTEDKKQDAKELPKIAPEQQALTERTKELNTQPLPDKKVDAALDKAAAAMEKAKDSLEEKKAPEAAKNQEKAIAALEEAKKAADQALADAQKAQDQALPNAAQQVAKAIEQAQKAQENAQQAAQQPNLAEMQKQVAQDAQKQGLQAAKPADKAAEALQKGDLHKAVQEQAQALAQLAQAAEKGEHPAQPQGEKGQAEKGEKAEGEKGQGEKGQGEKGQGEKGQGEKGQGEKGQPTPGQLAQKQAELLAATQALLNSENANAAAEQATGQAQALAPQGVQPQLGQAQQALAQAQQALQGAQPAPAAQAQGQALQSLNQALAALNAQLAAMGLPEVHPGQPSDATAQGEPHQGEGKEPGQGQGKEPGQGQGKEPGQGQGEEPGQGQGQKPGKSQEQNQSQGKGDRNPDGTLKNTASSLLDLKGGDSFLYLPPKQRDLIRQALSEGLPAEYAAQIQQYYVNLARGRAATTPAGTEKKK